MLNNVPLSGQTLGNSRAQINGNFAVIDTAFSVNHVPYNDGSGNQGMHQFVQMPAAVPTIATAAGQIGLYARTGVSSGQPELFFQRQSLGANTGYAITESGTGTFTTGAGTSYNYLWTRLPSGLVQLWGQQTNTGPSIPSGGLIITFPTSGSFPGFTTSCYNVMVSMQWLGAAAFGLDRPIAVVQGSITRLQFNINISQNGNWPGSGSLSFTAIGI